MAATERASEAELENFLREDPKFAITFLDTDYREQIIRYIKRVTWGRLGPDDLIEVYQETLLAFWQKARKAGFDPSRPLRLVNAIAHAKGMDRLRKRKREHLTNEDSLIGAVAGCLKDSEAGHRWNLLTNFDRNEFREVVYAAAAELPDRQKVVAQCYLDCFVQVQLERSFRPLAAAVSEQTGQQETTTAVKSLWHAAKKKLALELARKGFNFIKSE